MLNDQIVFVDVVKKKKNIDQVVNKQTDDLFLIELQTDYYKTLTYEDKYGM